MSTHYRVFTKLGGYRHYVTGKDDEDVVNVDMDRRKAMEFNSEEEVDEYMKNFLDEWHVIEFERSE